MAKNELDPIQGEIRDTDDGHATYILSQLQLITESRFTRPSTKARAIKKIHAAIREKISLGELKPEVLTEYSIPSEDEEDPIDWRE